MGLGLFVGVWIARYLGPDQFGLFNYATAFVGLFSAIAGLGLQGIVVRDIVRNPESAPEALGTAAVLQVIGGLIAYLLILAVIAYVRPADALARCIVGILGSAMLLKASEIAIFWFESQVQSKYTVWVQNSAFLVFAAVKVILILQQGSLISFVWTTLAEAAVAAFILLGVMGRRGSPLAKLRFSAERAKSLLNASWPLIFASAAISIGMRIDQVIIGEMLDDTAVGYYAAGVRLAEAFIFIGAAVSQSVFPRLILLDENQFEREYIIYLRWPFYFLLFLAVVILFYSRDIVIMLYGIEYINSQIVISILIFTMPITYVSIMSYNYLLKTGQQKEILLRQSYGLLLNLILNFFLITSFGIAGAALATLMAELLISFGMDMRSSKHRKLLGLKVRAIFMHTS